MGVKVGVTMSPFKGLARQKQRNVEKSDDQRKAALETKATLGIPWTADDHQFMYGNQEMLKQLGGKSQKQWREEEATRKRGIEREEFKYKEKTKKEYSTKEPQVWAQQLAIILKEAADKGKPMTAGEGLRELKRLGRGQLDELAEQIKVLQLQYLKGKGGRTQTKDIQDTATKWQAAKDKFEKPYKGKGGRWANKPSAQEVANFNKNVAHPLNKHYEFPIEEGFGKYTQKIITPQTSPIVSEAPQGGTTPTITTPPTTTIPSQTTGTFSMEDVKATMAAFPQIGSVGEAIKLMKKKGLAFSGR